MSSKTIKATMWLAVLTVVVAIIAMTTIRNFYPESVTLYRSAFAICCFFGSFDLLTLFALDRTQEDNMKYNRTFMLLKALKLFLSILGAVVYVFVNRDLAVPFLATFAIIYAIYTVFEAIVLLKLNK